MTMGAVVIVGEPALVHAYAMAGATVVPAEGPAQVRRAWGRLTADTTLVILTARGGGTPHRRTALRGYTCRGDARMTALQSRARAARLGTGSRRDTTRGRRRCASS